ncbi:MAG: transporter substrate-binding domain-containing protein [Pseudomonadales bacterium]|nr:transporter substrate-binding domain-containing protein [Pseudomonadales bacterium]
MRVFSWIFMGLACLWLLGCDQDASAPGENTPVIVEKAPSEEPEAPVWENTPMLEDLSVLRQGGFIRFLTPTVDGEPGLARNGYAAGEYRRLAELLAESLGLEAKWIYVDYFDQLLPKLEQGLGDVVVTNLTVTESRSQRVNFSLPVANVDELLVVAKAHKGKSLADLPSMKVSVPKGTSYVESMTEVSEAHPHLITHVMDSDLSDVAMIEAVANGTMEAVVVDSNITVEHFQSLANAELYGAVIGPVVKAKRDIAWAVRKGNPEILTALNRFFIAERIEASANKAEKRDWQAIKDNRTLRLITTNNPASYFILRGELMGFDYDMVRKFADQNRLRLQVLVKDSLEDMWQALQRGEGDLIAAAVTATEDREKQGILFTRPYLQVKEQLISRADEPMLEDVSELRHRVIAVNPEKAYRETLAAIEKQLATTKHTHAKQPHLPKGTTTMKIMEVPGITTEELIDAVAQGKYDFTLADSHLAQIETTYRSDIKVQLDLSEDRPIAFALRKDQTQFKSELDVFIKKQYRGLFYNVTFNKYFKNKKNILKNKKHRVEPNKPISPFDDIVKRHAQEHGYDWRLVTSQMFQESRFDPKAKSYAGAQGLMQVLPRTARQFGYEDLFDPEEGIEAGVVYFDWLRDRFPAELPLEEQMYFMLAAYNAGHGHVRDARRLAAQLGKDPNRWFGNVEEAMLLLSKPKYAKKARFGYVRGIEPVNYVKSIRQRYLSYLSTHGESQQTGQKMGSMEEKASTISGSN